MFTFTVQYRYPYLNQVVSGPKWLNPYCAEKPQNGPAGEIFSRGGRFLAETAPPAPAPIPNAQNFIPPKSYNKQGDHRPPQPPGAGR
jgi:hypothetical protein